MQDLYTAVPRSKCKIQTIIATLASQSDVVTPLLRRRHVTDVCADNFRDQIGCKDWPSISPAQANLRDNKPLEQARSSAAENLNLNQWSMARSYPRSPMAQVAPARAECRSQRDHSRVRQIRLINFFRDALRTRIVPQSQDRNHSVVVNHLVQ